MSPVGEDRLTKLYFSNEAGEMVEACCPNPSLVMTAWSTPVATVKSCCTDQSANRCHGFDFLDQFSYQSKQYAPIVRPYRPDQG